MEKKYFVFSPEGCGFETFATEEEAKSCMRKEQELFQNEANNNHEWSLECDAATMGKITHRHKLVGNGELNEQQEEFKRLELVDV